MFKSSHILIKHVPGSFLHLHLFKMAIDLRIGFAAYFLGDFILSIVFAYKDERYLRTEGSRYLWDRITIVLFTIIEATVSIFGTFVIVDSYIRDIEPYRPEAFVLCTLQLSVGANVRRFSKTVDSHLQSTQLVRAIRIWNCARWTIWLAYIVTILTAPDIASLFR